MLTGNINYLPAYDGTCVYVYFKRKMSKFTQHK